MTTPSRPRARATERSLRRIFAAPVVISLTSSVGLVSALVGDGLMDAVAWVGLGIPVAASAWYALSRKTS